MFKRRSLCAATMFAALAAPAYATSVALTTDSNNAGYGQWVHFDVSDLDAKTFGVEWIDNANSLSPDFGTPLTFTFTIQPGGIGRLTVVDAAFGGDTFRVTNSGSVLGLTSAVPVTDFATAANVGLDFGAALANPSFSRGVFTLGAGDYQISGALEQSVLAGGLPLNTTVGAVSLTVSAVPEPSSLALMVAGIALIGTMVRRRP